MKKIISLLCAATIGVSACIAVSATHTGIQNTDELEKARVMQLLEIMNGDENGNLNLDNTVTRAEFVKMIVSASPYKSSAGKSSAVSMFPDVTSGHWAAGYISAAINGGLLTGYLDGTFRPENNVTLEEAVVVILKLLGYTASDFQGTYPEAQLAKYEEIDLDTSISAKRGDILTRRECMKLIYNALCTKTKQGSYYCTTLGYSLDGDNTIDYLSLLTSDMTGPFVNTQNGVWQTKATFADNANTVLYRDGKAVNADQIDTYDVYYYSDKIKTVWFYSDKVFGRIDGIAPNLETPQSVIIGNATYSLTPTAAKRVTAGGEVAEDDYVMLLCDKDGKIADIIPADAETYNRYSDKDADLLAEVNKTVSDPIVVSDLTAYKSEIPFDIAKAEILFDGERITSSQIKLYDVLYYSVPFNTVWVFRDVKNGVCTAVSPSRESPTAVVVGGKSYALSTDTARYKFSNYGLLKADMLVTLLLGKDGSVVDALPAGLEVIGDGEDMVSYGEVVASGLKGPYVANANGKLSSDTAINLDTAIVYRGGKLSSIKDIKQYDVYYYSKILNTVWLYSDTASGYVEAISPNKMSPNAITLSGKTYSLGTVSAQFEFSALGSFDIGDRVTLLLGKDGEAAGVVKAGTVETGVVYGVVLSSGEQTYADADGKKYVSDTVTVYTTSGDVYTYQTGGSFDAGKPVKVVVGENKVNISGLSSPKSVSSALKYTDAVKNGKFASDVEIIEYFNESIYGKVVASRISGGDMWYNDIMYCELNENGEITKLILDNYTGDLVEYGLLTEVDGSYYKYIIDDVEKSYSSGDVKFTVSEGAAYFAMNGQNIVKIGSIKANIEIATVVGNKAYTAKNAEYTIDDNARVYVRQGTDYKVYDTDILKTNNYSTVIGYYDKAPEYGGKIRVIVAY